MGTLIVNPYLNKLWTPEAITTALWLDAADSSTITQSGGLVSQWNDKSGNSYNATQTDATFKPTTSTLNTKNVISFNLDFFNVSTPPTSVSAVFFVTNNLNVSSVISPVFGQLTAGTNYTFVRTNATDYSISIDGASLNSGGASVNGGSIQSGGNIDLGLSIAQKGSANIWYCQFDNVIPDISYIFYFSTGSSDYYGIGDLAEILFLTTIPSVDTRQKLEGYLAHKWGLTANLPITHPYKNTPPYV